MTFVKFTVPLVENFYCWVLQFPMSKGVKSSENPVFLLRSEILFKEIGLISESRAQIH